MTCWTKTRDGYRIDAQALAAHLDGYGLDVVIEAGAQARGHGAFRAPATGLVIHHTATPATAKGDYPSMRVVRDGRGDLAGPLAQLGLGRSGRVYIIATGLAWHAGRVHQAKMDNWNTIGIEAEHPGGSTPWPDKQYDAYVRLARGLQHADGLALEAIWGHKEVAAPAGRKSDPTFDMGGFRRAVLDGPRPAGLPATGGRTTPVLQLGSTGLGVTRLQSALARGYSYARGLAVDGSYGPATKAAVQEWQRRTQAEGKYRGPVDGIVGPLTAAAMRRYGMYI